MAQGCHEAFHIGVGAHPATPIQGHQGVDGAHPLGQGTAFPAEFCHGLLVGDGHAEAPAAHGLQAPHHRGQISGWGR